MNVKTAVIAETRVATGRGHTADYFELTKPRVTAMVLAATTAGYYLGARSSVEFVTALNLMIGTGLAAGGSLALNQYIERETDAVMNRTRNRPLPEARLTPSEALWFGVISTGLGLAYLAVTVNWLCTAVIAATAITYLFAYTPLKRISWWCTPVGAVPGALPPVAGWAAARGSLEAGAFVLFAIMFLWQLPHALSIAKLYRDDYVRVRLWLLPLDRDDGYPENMVILGGSIMLIAAGALPTLVGLAGIAYLVVAVALGCVMFGCALVLVRGPDTAARARRVVFASLIYLPVVLLAMALDKI